MKQKLFIVTSVFLFTCHFVFGGGMVHNTNQSAAWIRTCVRDASVGIDAVYYNPAGLTQLVDGFHVSLTNQFITQEREIINSHPLLNDASYPGEVNVPFLPSFFAAYKKNKLAVSAGFIVVGGGGGAEYSRGLPSFEIPVAGLPVSLAALQAVDQAVPDVDLNVTGYSTKIFFEGSSAYYGIQAGVSYALTDMISVSVGGRYIMAKNTYKGTIEDISVETASGSMRADDFLNDVAVPTINSVAEQAKGGALLATSGATKLQPAIDAGIGGLTPADAQAAGAMTEQDVTEITQGLESLGIDPAGLTIEQAQNAFTSGATQLEAQAAELEANSAVLSATAGGLADKEVDVVQTGSTFTPIIGINLALMDNQLNIGMKYEHHSTMEVENDTKIDQTATQPDGSDALFPDGVKVPADIPGMFSVGAQYKLSDKLSVSAGYHQYMDKGAKYGKKLEGEYVKNEKLLENNAYEYAIGLEYGINEKFLVSLGYLRTSSFPKSDYQSDMSFSLSSNNIGFGGMYNITPDLALDLGVFYTKYIDDSKEIDYGTTIGLTTEEYKKSNIVFGVGLSYALKSQ